MGKPAYIVFNAGSSSIKFAAFDEAFSRVLAGEVTEIGGKSSFSFNGLKDARKIANHADAVALIVAAFDQEGVDFQSLKAVAHRVVHGGELFADIEPVTDDVIAGIDALSALAPLHNPHNLKAIRTIHETYPDLPQYAVFDTGFHRTIDETWNSYALPVELRAKGYRRYGFHGISMTGLVSEMRRRYTSFPQRILGFHLGNGASITAILDGKSVATSMGFSPLEGLVMGTRTGSIDGNLVLQMVHSLGIEATARVLNKESGLLGLCGISDMREIEASSSEDAKLALAIFIERAAQYGASMLPRLGGLDAIVFTGGIGENSTRIRAGILERLAYMGACFDEAANQTAQAQIHHLSSPITIDIVRADEERTMVEEIVSRLSC